MTIDTSREAVERLLAERDAALADVARLSAPPDDAEVAVLEGWLRNPWSKAAPGTERGPIPEWVYALMHQAADALTRLFHAHAAETAKREAMEDALRFYADKNRFGLPSDGPWGAGSTDFGRLARATLAQHGKVK